MERYDSQLEILKSDSQKEKKERLKRLEETTKLDEKFKAFALNQFRQIYSKERVSEKEYLEVIKFLERKNPNELNKLWHIFG